jgi:hypothetical protein
MHRRQLRGAAHVTSSLTSLADVGGGRSAGEASPLIWRRLPKRRFVTSIGAAEKTHRAMLPGGPDETSVQPRAAMRRDCLVSVETHPRHIFGSCLHLRGYRGYYALVGPDSRSIFRPRGRKRSLHVCLCRSEDGLISKFTLVWLELRHSHDATK